MTTKSYWTRYFVLAIGLLIAMILPMAVRAQESPAQVGIFDSVQVAPGEVVQVPIYIKDVQDLYGFDVIINFEPKVVQVEDADTAVPNIQVSLGDFLDAGLLLFNIADNEKGSIRFTMSQYNPSEPKSGDGILFVVRFKGVAEGESQLKTSFVQLATRDGIEITAKGVDSQITVISGVPVQEATLPPVSSTGIIIVATETPTPTATSMPTNTATKPVQTATPVASSTSLDEIIGNIDVNNETKKDSSLWIRNNWWLLLIIAGVILIPGGYVLIKKKLRKEENDG